MRHQGRAFGIVPFSICDGNRTSTLIQLAQHFCRQIGISGEDYTAVGRREDRNSKVGCDRRLNDGYDVPRRLLVAEYCCALMVSGTQRPGGYIRPYSGTTVRSYLTCEKAVLQKIIAMLITRIER